MVNRGFIFVLAGGGVGKGEVLTADGSGAADGRCLHADVPRVPQVKGLRMP